jgi:hypothetical protein
MQASIEALAKMAARSAGYGPDNGLVDQSAELPGLDGPAWQHPKFITLAEAAYAILTAPPFPEELQSAAPGLVVR